MCLAPLSPRDFPTPRLPPTAQGDGSYFFDRDPTHFRKVLNFFRTGTFVPPESAEAALELHLECQYYGVEPLIGPTMELVLAHSPVSAVSASDMTFGHDGSGQAGDSLFPITWEAGDPSWLAIDLASPRTVSRLEATFVLCPTDGLALPEGVRLAYAVGPGGGGGDGGGDGDDKAGDEPDDEDGLIVLSDDFPINVAINSGGPGARNAGNSLTIAMTAVDVAPTSPVTQVRLLFSGRVRRPGTRFAVTGVSIEGAAVPVL